MPARTTHVRFSPDGKVLAAGMFGGLVRFLTWETLQPLAQVGCFVLRSMEVDIF